MPKVVKLENSLRQTLQNLKVSLICKIRVLFAYNRKTFDKYIVHISQLPTFVSYE